MNESRVVRPRQLLDLHKRLDLELRNKLLWQEQGLFEADRPKNDPRRITPDMVERLISTNGYRSPICSFNELNIAILEAVKKCDGEGGLTREKLQSFLRDPLGTLSDKVVANHTKLVSNPAFTRAESIHRRICDVGLIDGLPSWFDGALENPNYDFLCGPGEMVVHRLCFGDVTVRAGRQMIQAKNLNPSGIDILLSFAEVNEYKHPYIATGTLVYHKDELMTSPEEYAPELYYSPDGMGRICLCSTASPVLANTSFLAVY